MGSMGPEEDVLRVDDDFNSDFALEASALTGALLPRVALAARVAPKTVATSRLARSRMASSFRQDWSARGS